MSEYTGGAARGAPLVSEVGLQFDSAFRALTGHPPLKWQRRLFERLSGVN
jgi:hypothetical protein